MNQRRTALLRDRPKHYDPDGSNERMHAMSLGWMKAVLSSPRWLLGALLMGLGVSIIGAKLLGQDNFRSPSDPRYDRNDPRYNNAPLNNNSDPRYNNDPIKNNIDPRYDRTDPRYRDRIAREDPRYRNDGGRESVDDLLKPLMQNNYDQRNQNSLFDPSRNNSPYPPRTNPTSPTSQMLEARRVLANVSQDADQLATLLTNDMRRVPGLRPYLDDVLSLRARVSTLADRARQYNDPQYILPDLKDLDRDWRLLSYRLAQIRGLDNRTISQIKRLNSYAKELGKTFEISPQLDRQGLLQKTTSLATDLHNLLDDIEIEVPRSQQQIDLLLRGRRIEQQARQVASTVTDTGDYQQVAAQYREFQRVWYPFATDLRPLNNRYVERSVRRVNDVDSSIHELLWLPYQMDRDKLLYLCSVLKRDVDDFFARAPLKLMIELPNSDQVLTVADEFYGVCQNFNDVVSRGEDTQQVVDAYHYIEDSWRKFSSLFRPLKSQAAQQVLAEIDNNIVALGQALQVQAGTSQTGYNEQNAVEIAASLDNLSRHLENDIGQWLSTSAVNFRDYALQDAAQFRQSCQRIHELLARGANLADLSQEADLLARDWRRVYDDIQRCTTADKPHLLRTAAQISPQVVELRTVLVQ